MNLSTNRFSQFQFRTHRYLQRVEILIPHRPKAVHVNLFLCENRSKLFELKPTQQLPHASIELWMLPRRDGASQITTTTAASFCLFMCRRSRPRRDASSQITRRRIVVVDADDLPARPTLRVRPTRVTQSSVDARSETIGNARAEVARALRLSSVGV